MMKKIGLMFVLGFAFLLAACGNMTQDDVVGKLTSNLRDATSYFTQGTMTLESDGQTYEYAIQVAFQRNAGDGMFRVAMRNETTNNEQIILKNDEGVFVLTPSLNKKFKFQSDWPLSSSQIYLYQSLLGDILNDENAVFTAGESSYTFETAANYHGNSDLVTQTVEFSRDKLTPISATVKDSNGTVRMSMVFDSFEFNAEILDSFFDSEAAMEQTQNTWGLVDASPIDLGSLDFVIPASAMPTGTMMTNHTAFATPGGGERIITTFDGEQSFTLIQESGMGNDDWRTTFTDATPVFVGNMVGFLSDNTITWMRDGVEFSIMSNSLDADQLVTVASSVTADYVK
ncbi:MAG: outer membrane lipoprotein carrier protein LolA [Turicibacter sp.]|nr:outer membrane lipoprotein carrier protein LolA [Turicibacter sp.]